jgi:hypothetical protein
LSPSPKDLGLTPQQLRERQIEKKRFEDTLKLTIFNQEKLQGEENQDQVIEDQKRAQEEARKVLERE